MWGMRRPPDRREHRMQAIDVAAAVALVAGGVATLAVDSRPDAGGADLTVVTVALVAAAGMPIALRRRFPLAALVTTSIASVAAAAALVGGPHSLAVALCLYTVASRVPDPRRVQALVAFIPAALAALAVLALAVDDFDDSAVIPTAISFIAASVIGDNVRRRRERAADERARLEHEAREREALTRQLVLDERARIARELHDVVAHSVSVMVIQAGAARRQLPEHPQRAGEVLMTIEDTGRTAMREMRRLLGVLRTDTSPELLPQPGLGAIHQLVDDGQLPVSLSISLGPGDDGTLPPAVEVNAYRVVQESLTNVRRHAGPVRHVGVRIERIDDVLSVEVADDGRGAAHAATAEPGFGLIGMRERVTAFGGALSAGPRAGGGWLVRATFPIGAPT